MIQSVGNIKDADADQRKLTVPVVTDEPIMMGSQALKNCFSIGRTNYRKAYGIGLSFGEEQPEVIKRK